jgi:hypothetical protein
VTARFLKIRVRLFALAVIALLLAGGGASLHVITRSAPCPPAHAGAYQWPVQPFDAVHPIRGNFGDPRTIYRGPLGDVDLGDSASFHDGVDIVARDGWPVYPVVSGIAHVPDPDEVVVDSGRRRFQYWHIVAAVADGQRVCVGRTVLGHVARGAHHVHLTEVDRGHAVNPLQPAHLTPYADHTAPVVASLVVRGAEGKPVSRFDVRGHIRLVVDAYDRPSPRPWGAWSDARVSPARIVWRLTRPDGRNGPLHVAVDFRRLLPEQREFWKVYASGTYQNFPVIANRYHWGLPSRPLFNLTRAPLDTRLLEDGPNVLTVVAEDERGNRGSLRTVLVVHNGRRGLRV